MSILITICILQYILGFILAAHTCYLGDKKYMTPYEYILLFIFYVPTYIYSFIIPNFWTWFTHD